MQMPGYVSRTDRPLARIARPVRARARQAADTPART